MPASTLIALFCALICLAGAASVRSVYVDQHYDGIMNDYDDEVLKLVDELNPLVDYRGPVDENHVRTIVGAADFYQRLAKSRESARYTRMFPLFQDGIDEAIIRAVTEFADDQAPQHLLETLQTHAQSARSRASLREK